MPVGLDRDLRRGGVGRRARGRIRRGETGATIASACDVANIEEGHVVDDTGGAGG